MDAATYSTFRELETEIKTTLLKQAVQTENITS